MSEKSRKRVRKAALEAATTPAAPTRLRRHRLIATVIAACVLFAAAFAATRFEPVRRVAGLRPLTVVQQPTPTPLPLSKEYIYAGGRLVATEEALSRPYPNGVAHAIPGTVQAEDFDQGGEGVAYHDIDTHFSQAYRTGEHVWVENCSNPDGACNVGSTWSGEWLEYTVEVAAAGVYNLEARVASGNGGGGTFRVDFDGVPMTGALTVPNTGGWQTYQTLSVNVTLTAGRHVMRLTMLGNGTGGGAGNFNYFRFTTGAAGPPPTALVATGYFPSSNSVAVKLVWSAPSGATPTGYIVERASSRNSDGPAYVVLGVPVTTLPTQVNPYVDQAPADAVYLYRVKAVYAGGYSGFCTPDLATTKRYTGDDPLIAGASVVRAADLTELRAVVESVRALAGMGAGVWKSNPSPLSNGSILKDHFKELRDNLNPALSALDIAQLPVDETLAVGLRVKAVHIQDVRDKVR